MRSVKPLSQTNEMICMESRPGVCTKFACRVGVMTGGWNKEGFVWFIAFKVVFPYKENVMCTRVDVKKRGKQ